MSVLESLKKSGVALNIVLYNTLENAPAKEIINIAQKAVAEILQPVHVQGTTKA